jgi:hypothetical protein
LLLLLLLLPWRYQCWFHHHSRRRSAATHCRCCFQNTSCTTQNVREKCQQSYLQQIAFSPAAAAAAATAL